MNGILGLMLLAVAWAASGAESVSPYAQEAGAFQGLSVDEIHGLMTGEGMGMARPAELNHYPGPRHVLDLAPELGLTPEQLESTEAVYERMRTQAQALGERIVKEERALNKVFASGTPDVLSLESRLASIGQLRAQLRLAHLAAHLELRPILSQAQVELYDQLRGYSEAAPMTQGQQGHGHGHGHGQSHGLN